MFLSCAGHVQNMCMSKSVTYGKKFNLEVEKRSDFLLASTNFSNF